MTTFQAANSGGQRLLLIDNYDSFTYNLVQAFLVCGAEVDVRRNDEITVAAALALQPTHLCISPGPGTPQDAGVSIAMIRAFAGRVPVFGVCLGHQSIVEAFGGSLDLLGYPMHGKHSMVEHQSIGVFEGLPSPLKVGRYHSLHARRSDLPAELEITAESDDGVIMGLRHRELPVEAVQFHPESMLTLHDAAGLRLIQNAIRLLGKTAVSA